MNVSAVNADAGETLTSLTDEYDFIFMDCAKAQYIKYLPELKRLLKKAERLLRTTCSSSAGLRARAKFPKSGKCFINTYANTLRR